MDERRRQALHLAGKLEEFLSWGGHVATVMAPDKAATWGRALLLVRCLRFELGKPENTGRR